MVNYNTALYLKAPTGLYSLGGNPEDPSDIDGVAYPDIKPLSVPPTALSIKV